MNFGCFRLFFCRFLCRFFCFRRFLLYFSQPGARLPVFSAPDTSRGGGGDPWLGCVVFFTRKNTDFDIKNTDFDKEIIDFDKENLDFDGENLDFDGESIDLDGEKRTTLILFDGKTLIFVDFCLQKI
jgi:hypothetical protein